MNRIIYSLFLLVAITALSTPSFAARQSIIAGSIQLSPDGVLNGVDITGASTLLVGVVSTDPAKDIFTSNSSLTSPFLAVSTGADHFGAIDFNSSSTVYGDIGATGTKLNYIQAFDDITVNFLGSVFAYTLDTGTGTTNFNSGSTNFAATNFTGDGIISLAPNTTLEGALITATANTGTLLLGGGSILDGAVGGATGLKSINVVGGSNLAGVSANITGAVDAYSFSLGTNTLNIGGALVLHDASVINTTLASSSLYGHIIPVGNSTIGATVEVNVLVPSTAYIPVGTLFNIVQATSGTDGSVVAVTVQNPTNPLYTFAASPLTGTTAGSVTIITTAIPMQASQNPPPGQTLPPAAPIASTVASNLMDIPNPPPDLTNVLAAINALTNVNDIVNAEVQLAPSTPGLVVPLVTFQGAKQFQNLWLSRLDDALCNQINNSEEEVSICKGVDPHSGWWLRSFGYFGDQDTRDAFAGYDSRILGAMIAYDVPLQASPRSETRAGLGIGYARSNIEGKTFDTSTDANTYQATAYIGHEVGHWFVNSNVSFGWNDYSGTRHISFTGIDRKAEAEYSGQDYTSYVNTGFHFFTQGFTITPLASLQYTHMDIDNYTETGAGDVNLKVKSQGYDFIESGLGIKLARGFVYKNSTYVPDIHFKWLYEIKNPKLENIATYDVSGAQPFVTSGLKTDNNTYNVGVGLNVLSCECSDKTWSVDAVYDYDWRRDDYSGHQGMMKFTSRF